MTALRKRKLEEQPDATQPGQPHDNAPPAQSAGQKLRRKPLAYPSIQQLALLALTAYSTTDTPLA